MRFRTRLGWLIVVAAACDSPMIPGRDATDVYAFELETQPPLVMHWPTGRAVRVFVARGSSDPRTALLASAFDNGASAWNELAAFAEYRLVPVNNVTLADVVLVWSDVVPPVTTDACRPAVTQAVTTFCIVAAGTDSARLRVFPLRPPADASASRVKMLVTILAAEAASPTVVQRLVAHELGHVLGIARHSDDARDLMWRTDPAVARPSPRDAATVQVLYHVRADIVP
jgi:hypothetical protein